MGWFKTKKQNTDTHQSNESSVHRYEALTPVTNIENGKEYKAALDWALSQADVHNIAISGPYGSGKSSVIESYLFESDRKDVVRISLAAFNLDEMLDENKKIIDTDKLETGILKQLFYSVETKKIPQSRYRKLQTIKESSNRLMAVLMMAVLGVLIAFVAPEKTTKFVDAIFVHHIVFAVLECLGIATVLWYALSCFIGWLRKNGSVQEIKILDKATIKNNSENKESIFNKNMDEIVYFFEMTGKKLVVIEDLDRFESTNIFVALRELNSILNNNEKIGGCVRFIYAIKDDMFDEDEERTKFFDFIIPIVPYISSTNSGEILRDRLQFDKSKNRSSLYEISGGFVSMISPYISDTRELLCICNEFQVFKNTLKGNQSLDLDDEKMFALIVFKNRYPKDFAELEDESEQSIVLKAFKDKANLIENKKELIDEKKDAEKKKIELIEKDALHSVKELKIVLLSSLTKHQAAVSMITFDNQNHPVSELLGDDFDVSELKGKRLIIHHVNGGNRDNQTIANIEDTIKQAGEDYYGRIGRLLDGVEKCKDESRKVIEDYEREINGLRAFTIKQLIAKFGTDFLDEQVRKNDLLVFLLRNGYLDETYENYINYFHPNSITKDEMNFILGVRNRRFEGGYSYSLKNASRIFDELQDFEFEQKEVLNFNLVDFVLEKRITSSSAKCLFRQLSDHSQESMLFIKAYVERGNHLDIFIKSLCHVNEGLWNDVTADDGIPMDTKYQYLVLLLKYADMQDIIALDGDSSDEEKRSLSSFMLTNSEVLNKIREVPVEKQIELICELDLIFGDVELDSIDERIKCEIFDNHRYEINTVMLQRLFEWKNPQFVEDLEKKNYTIICDFEYNPLLDYIQDNFVEYVENIILGVETNTEEDIVAVNDIVERLIPENEELAIQVLDKEKVIWTDITECCADIREDAGESKKKIWEYVISNDRMACAWNNLSAWYLQYDSQKEWVDYIERHIDILLEDSDNESITSEIKEAVLLSKLSEKSFRKYISKMDMPPYTGKLSSLGAMKVCIMVDEGVLPFTMEYWAEMKTVAPDCRVSYAEANTDEFIKNIDEVDVGIVEYNALLASQVFKSEDVFTIMKLVPVESLTKESAMIIRELTFRVDKAYSDASWELLDESDKYQLLLNQIENYEKDELSEMFGELNEVYHPLMDRTRRHKVHLSYSKYNKALMDKLFEIEYITAPKEEWEEKGLLKHEKEHVLTAFVKAIQ